MKKFFGLNYIDQVMTYPPPLRKLQKLFIRSFFQCWESNFVFRQEKINYFREAGLNISQQITLFELIKHVRNLILLYFINYLDDLEKNQRTAKEPSVIFNWFQIRSSGKKNPSSEKSLADKKINQKKKTNQKNQQKLNLLKAKFLLHSQTPVYSSLYESSESQ